MCWSSMTTSESFPDSMAGQSFADDFRLTRLMMARMIVRLGHQVNTAENGREALEKITDAFHLKEDATPVDVVFLDK